jgi:hypothetical protein
MKHAAAVAVQFLNSRQVSMHPLLEQDRLGWLPNPPLQSTIVGATEVR